MSNDYFARSMNMITVAQADDIIRSQCRDYGNEEIPYDTALGRVLAEDLFADRDLPPFNRAAVDGIAIRYSAYSEGINTFRIRGTQPAGASPIGIAQKEDCVEIMTGAALDESVDTVVRYEDIGIAAERATIKGVSIEKGQNVHLRGKDKRAGDLVADADRTVTPSLLGLAASVGKTTLTVKKRPGVVIISTGDEMIGPDTIPGPYQLRRSNGIVIKSVLARYCIQADLLHLNDDYALIKNELERCLGQYDIVLMSGGVSMGKFDYLPQALEDLNVEKLFYKVKQRPGKPFWFGRHPDNAVIFALPGNPVSVFMCLHRYVIPWLRLSMGVKSPPYEYAVLQSDIHFPYPLQYFPQVKLAVSEQGQLLATPVGTNGSGDFSNLIYTDAFMELPLEKSDFSSGEVYKVWRYNL